MLKFFKPAFALMLLALGSSAFAADTPGVTPWSGSHAPRPARGRDTRLTACRHAACLRLFGLAFFSREAFSKAGRAPGPGWT